MTGMVIHQHFFHSFPSETHTRPPTLPPHRNISHTDAVARYFGGSSCGSGTGVYAGGPSGDDGSCSDSRFILGSRWWAGSGTVMWPVETKGGGNSPRPFQGTEEMEWLEEREEEEERGLVGISRIESPLLMLLLLLAVDVVLALAILTRLMEGAMEMMGISWECPSGPAAAMMLGGGGFTYHTHTVCPFSASSWPVSEYQWMRLRCRSWRSNRVPRIGDSVRRSLERRASRCGSLCGHMVDLDLGMRSLDD